MRFRQETRGQLSFGSYFDLTTRFLLLWHPMKAGPSMARPPTRCQHHMSVRRIKVTSRQIVNLVSVDKLGFLKNC